MPVRLQFEIDHVSHFQSYFLSMFVSLGFHPVLSLLQVLLNLYGNFFCCNIRGQGCCSIFRWEKQLSKLWRWSAIQCLKRGHLERSVKRCVIPPFSQSQLVMPFLWLQECHVADIVFQTLVNSFCLAICLRMIGSTKVKLDS